MVAVAMLEVERRARRERVRVRGWRWRCIVGELLGVEGSCTVGRRGEYERRTGVEGRRARVLYLHIYIEI